MRKHGSLLWRERIATKRTIYCDPNKAIPNFAGLHGTKPYKRGEGGWRKIQVIQQLLGAARSVARGID
jgi:hypothetical protein